MNLKRAEFRDDIVDFGTDMLFFSHRLQDFRVFTQSAAAADTAPLGPIDPWYSLAAGAGASARPVTEVRRS